MLACYEFCRVFFVYGQFVQSTNCIKTDYIDYLLYDTLLMSMYGQLWGAAKKSNIK